VSPRGWGNKRRGSAPRLSSMKPSAEEGKWKVFDSLIDFVDQYKATDRFVANNS
jgi:hypothetical protein